MAVEVKMVDLFGEVAANVFQMLNRDSVELKGPSMYCSNPILITDTEPSELVYPEGWYYHRGYLTNKNRSTTGRYAEVLMTKTNGELWQKSAKYCTANSAN